MEFDTSRLETSRPKKNRREFDLVDAWIQPAELQRFLLAFFAAASPMSREDFMIETLEQFCTAFEKTTKPGVEDSTLEAAKGLLARLLEIKNNGL